MTKNQVEKLRNRRKLWFKIGQEKHLFNQNSFYLNNTLPFLFCLTFLCKISFLFFNIKPTNFDADTLKI
jgi:hypothetical protein